MHAEPLHRPVTAGDGAVGHHPHQHVGDLGHQRREVPERVVSARRLRHPVVGLRLDRVDEVRKLHRVLDEEDRDVVADQIPVAFVGVELHGEAADVARGVGEDRGAGVLVERLETLEVAVRGRASRVDDPLGNALVVEVSDLLAEDEVLQQGRAPEPGRRIRSSRKRCWPRQSGQQVSSTHPHEVRRRVGVVLEGLVRVMRKRCRQLFRSRHFRGEIVGSNWYLFGRRQTYCCRPGLLGHDAPEDCNFRAGQW
jgi:hypothetical protein